ncbi:MAG: hypothetical protein KDA87_19045 [Planctomycetales bacterium]|nr:hypothetical protein [Planctomycetales bacterium]
MMRMIQKLTIIASVILLCSPLAAANIDAYARDAGNCKAVLEVEGKLTPAANGDQPVTIATSGSATLVYSELVSDGRSIRSYGSAEANLKIGDIQRTPSLRSNRNLIQLDLGEEPTFTSLQGPLTREELELLVVPFSSDTINRLFPIGDYQVGKQWQPAADDLRRWLNIETITDYDIQAEVVAVEDNIIRAEISGTATGSVRDAPSRITLKAKANFDLASQRVTWIAANIHEEREANPIAPGFDVTARVRLAITSADQNTTAQLTALHSSEPTDTSLLEFKPQNREFQLVHHRDWHLVSENHHLSVLRMVKEKVTVAQCNVRVLPIRDKQERMSLDTFQSHVHKSIGQPLKQIADATESTTSSGLRQLKVTAVGTVAESAIQWICYHISDETGHEISLVFTMTDEQSEAFAGADHELVNSIVVIRSTDEQAQSTVTSIR